MKQLAAGAARVLLALIGMLLLSVLSMFVIAVYLTTYPVMRLDQRNRRLRLGLDAAAAVAALLAELRPEPGDEVVPAPTDGEDDEPVDVRGQRQPG